MSNTITLQIDKRLSGGVESIPLKVNWKGKYLCVHRDLDHYAIGKVNPKAGYQVSHIATGLSVWKFPHRKLAEVKAKAKDLEALGTDWEFTHPAQVNLDLLRTRVVEILTRE